MDLDDELEMLQRELMAVQEEKTNPLSQRTVAEIMVKLYHEGFAFYPTTDGNQYITPHHLDNQIITLVKERGKINLNIIPQILNIGLDTIQSRVNSVLQKGNISRHANNLISSKYFDQLIMGLRHRLEAQGKIDLQHVAIENELNLQFVQKLVGDKLELLGAELAGNQLITREYTLLKKSKILGFLGALSNPISIDTFLKVTGLQNRSIEQTIEQLIAEGRLKGRFQSSYYVPDRFTLNQKRIILQFYDNNGFLECSTLQKKFLVSKPQEWLAKNLPQGGTIKLGGIYFKAEKLEWLAAQTNSLLKSEGFVELSQVLPIQLEEKSLQLFLDDYCHLKDYFLCDGYCYSNEWLERLTAEFKERIIHSIFFKKAVEKPKDKKKPNKKEKAESLTQEELQQILFNGGFAQYSVAEALAPELLPLVMERMEELRKKVEKQLVQNKGFLNTTFLKYRSAKTILRSEESLTRMLNIINKQQKKQKWIDSEFGPSECDKIGQYSLIYYDNALPKGWPALESLKWAHFTSSQLLLSDALDAHSNLRKSHFVSLLQIIDFHNARSASKVSQPEVNRLNQQSVSPFVYQFFIGEKERRLVIVDDRLPLVNQRLFASSGKYAFAQKAYAKLRYCYKAVLSVGIQQLIFEITGKSSVKYSARHQNDEDFVQTLQKHLEGGHLILLLAEGEGDKRLIWEDKQTEMLSMKLYTLYRSEGQLAIYPPNNSEITWPLLSELFKNVYVVE